MTLVTKLWRNTVANGQQSMHKMHPTINNIIRDGSRAASKSKIERFLIILDDDLGCCSSPRSASESSLPTVSAEEQHPNQNSTFLMHFSLFLENIPRGMKMKYSNFQAKEGRIHLKAMTGAKVNQLNHFFTPTFEEFDYDCAIIHVGINDILRSKDMSKQKDLPKNNSSRNNLSKL